MDFWTYLGASLATLALLIPFLNSGQIDGRSTNWRIRTFLGFFLVLVLLPLLAYAVIQ